MGRKISELFGCDAGCAGVGDGEIIEVKIDCKNNTVDITAGFFGGLSAVDIARAEREYERLLGFGKVTIHPKMQPEFLTASFAESLCEAMADRISCFSLCEGADFSISGSALTIGLKLGGNSILEQAGAGKALSAAIFDIFGVSVSVSFTGVTEINCDSDEYKSMMVPSAAEEVPFPEPQPERQAPAVHCEPEFVPERPGEKPVVHEGREKTVMLGRRIHEAPVPIDQVYAGHLTEDVVIEGTVFGAEKRDIKNGETTLLTFYITDGRNSIACKAFLKGEKKQITELVKNDLALKVAGRVEMDNYTKFDVLIPRDINLGQKTEVTDDAEKKRVELHLHTNMSALDALPTAEQVVNLAYKWGHRAVAITDHGVLQSFPNAMYTYEKIKKENPDADFKVIYGIEAYLANDVSGAVSKKCGLPLDGEFIVFDIETTGLSNQNDRITEIGAVRYRGGKTLESFDTFVNPGIKIPEKIVSLTGITDDMVREAPDEKTALEKFFGFAGSCPLVAHNADFDAGFIRAACTRNAMPFENPYIDTLAVARGLYHELKKYTLDSVAEHLELGKFNHHRACDDAAMLAAIWAKMDERLVNEGCKTTDDIEEFLAGGPVAKLPLHHCVLLVKNQTGLRHLYELVSDSHIKYFHSYPRMPKSLVSAKREGLIIGSACEAGELYRAIEDNKDFPSLYRIAEFYDYLEIQPLGNNDFLVRDGRVRDRQQLIEFNRKTLYIGEKLKKPVVATGDVHFLYPSDAKFREIILTAKEMKDAKYRTPLYFRNTREMLDEFSYLTPEEAERIVVTEPNRIADQIEIVRPIPKGTFPPSIDGADEQFTEIIYRKAKQLYGDPLPEAVAKRIERELTPVKKNGYSVLYLAAQKLVANSNENGYIVGSRGSVGSTVLAFLSGISEVNPLPPHYRCPNCRYSDFTVESPTGVGPDMPPMDCPKCGAKMIADGLEIPFETFLGFSGEKAPDIDLNFSNEYQDKAHKFTEEIFGSENCYKAGTISAIQERNAFGYVQKYCEKNNIVLSRAEQQRLADGCLGIKSTTGQHPGGIVVVPKGRDITEFTPVQYPANDRNSGIITTHFDFNSMHDTLLKMDELGHQIPTEFKYLKDSTGVDFSEIPLNDAKVMRLFSSTESLGVTPEQIGSMVGTLGLPEMGTEFVRQMLFEAQPKTFADLLQISGLSHGKGVWLGNAQDLIKDGTCTISTVIGLRDNIMLYLLKQGVEPKLAFQITEYVRKKPARKLTPEFVEELTKHGVPQWYIESCGKIEYMFPKAHAGAYVTSAIKLGWFKVYHPLEFYSAYFTVRGEDIDYDCAVGGMAVTKAKMSEIQKKGRDATAKEQSTFDMLQILVEMFARGFRFLGVDVKKSDAGIYKIEEGAIRLPFISVSGIGQNAASSVAAAAATDFSTVEDFEKLDGVTPSITETLKSLGAFGDIPDSNQLTLF